MNLRAGIPAAILKESERLLDLAALAPLRHPQNNVSQEAKHLYERGKHGRLHSGIRPVQGANSRSKDAVRLEEHLRNTTCQEDAR